MSQLTDVYADGSAALDAVARGLPEGAADVVLAYLREVTLTVRRSAERLTHDGRPPDAGTPRTQVPPPERSEP